MRAGSGSRRSRSQVKSGHPLLTPSTQYRATRGSACPDFSARPKCAEASAGVRVAPIRDSARGFPGRWGEGVQHQAFGTPTSTVVDIGPWGRSWMFQS